MSSKDIQLDTELKGLRSQLVKRQAEVITNESEAEVLYDRRGVLNELISDIENKIRLLTPKKPKHITFTEHSILRYLERVKGIDLKAIQGEILSERMIKNLNELGGTTTFKLGDHRIVVQNHKVITVK